MNWFIAELRNIIFLWKYRRRKVLVHQCASKMYRNSSINIKVASRIAALEGRVDVLEEWGVGHEIEATFTDIKDDLDLLEAEVDDLREEIHRLASIPSNISLVSLRMPMRDKK